MRLFLDGDNTAFEELVSRYESVIMKWPIASSANRSDAADVCQEVFVLLIRKLGSFRGEAKFSTWLYRVSLNACTTTTRAGRVATSPSPSPRRRPAGHRTAPGRRRLRLAGEKHGEADIQKTVREAIARLPYKFKEVIYISTISTAITIRRWPRDTGHIAGDGEVAPQLGACEIGE